MILALTSDSVSQGKLYDAASTVLAQKLSQVKGVGQVSVGGSSLPAVRVELNPMALNKYGIALPRQCAKHATNSNSPKGIIEQGTRSWQVYANDQARTAKEYLPLIVFYQNGAPVRLSDIARGHRFGSGSAQRGAFQRQAGSAADIFRQPNANIIGTVDRVRAALPQLRASISGAIDVDVVIDRSPTIRASVHDVEVTLAISIGLVIMVVFIFLRNVRVTLIPSVAVPVSLIGTFGVMYLCGYSLDNLSLMALTVATGFVVDDAIVVLENVSRHIEKGMPPFQAALRGSREVGFYRGLHERFAGCGVYSLAVDGWHRRPPAARVRGDPVGGCRGVPGCFAYNHADDVRALAQAQARGKAGTPECLCRALLQRTAACLPENARRGIAP